MYRVMVTGSRTWTNYELILSTLNDSWIAHNKMVDGVVVAHGGARGADTLARNAARSLGYGDRAFPAEWRTHGPDCDAQCRARQTCKRAGPRRNRRMFENFEPNLVIAFRADGDSPGTDHAISLAKAANCPVRLVHENGEVEWL